MKTYVTIFEDGDYYEVLYAGPSKEQAEVINEEKHQGKGRSVDIQTWEDGLRIETIILIKKT